MATTVFLMNFLSLISNTLYVDGHGDGDGHRHSGEDCLVQKLLNMDKLDGEDFLAYIRPSSPLNVSVWFMERSYIDWRDHISLNNTEAVQYLVRDGKSRIVRHPTTLIIPEGWSTFTLMVSDKQLVIMHQNIPFFSLPMEFDIKDVKLKGTVCRCHTVDPVWDLSEGEVDVPLQPVLKSMEVQEVRVTAPTHTTAYITFPHTKTTPTITTNCTLHVNLTSSNVHIINVYQVKVDGDVPVITTMQEVGSPLLLRVGTNSTNIQVHFSPRVHQDHEVDDANSSCQHIQQDGCTATTRWMIGLAVVNGYLCIIFVVMVLQYRKKMDALMKSVRHRCSSSSSSRSAQQEAKQVSQHLSSSKRWLSEQNISFLQHDRRQSGINDEEFTNVFFSTNKDNHTAKLSPTRKGGRSECVLSMENEDH